MIDLTKSDDVKFAISNGFARGQYKKGDTLKYHCGQTSCAPHPVKRMMMDLYQRGIVHLVQKKVYQEKVGPVFYDYLAVVK